MPVARFTLDDVVHECALLFQPQRRQRSGKISAAAGGAAEELYLMEHRADRLVTRARSRPVPEHWMRVAAMRAYARGERVRCHCYIIPFKPTGQRTGPLHETGTRCSISYRELQKYWI
jgi:hypothetical protein